MDLSCLDEGKGIEATFMEQVAKWHKSCHTEYNITKLRRAEKKRVSPEDSKPYFSPPRKKICLSRSTESVTKESSYFCEGTSEPLCAVCNYQVDNLFKICLSFAR